MLRDAEHFRSKLSKLDGAGDIGDMIVRIVKEKPIERIRDTEADAATGKPTEERVDATDEKSSREEISP
jgi:hypothetical protein